MLPVILLISGFTGVPLTWLCGMRPYVRRNGKGYRTGGNLYVAAWVDWQSCGEIDGDGSQTGKNLRILFVLCHLAFVAGILTMNQMFP